jgi:cyclic pyranopterin phosphate synthase
MLDQYNRTIDYLRISVTDRCNLRCLYCMPAEGIQLLRHEDILSFDEIAEVATVAAGMGVRKIRLTGGEPLVRRGITDLVRMLAAIPGITDLSMTTNGILLGKFAAELKEAGLMRVNISLDTLDPEKFRTVTRGGNIEDVLEGIEKAIGAGLSPIKLNCVVGGFNDESDAEAVKQFGHKRGLQVRFIREMDLAGGEFYVVEGGDGGNCRICNRLRLTSNGLVKPCLFNAQGFSVRELSAQQAIMSALEHKPKCGTFNMKEKFYNIGG